jgi:hypothetical protein
MLIFLNLSHPPYRRACYMLIFACRVRHVLTLVYSIASTTLKLLLKLGEV